MLLPLIIFIDLIEALQRQDVVAVVFFGVSAIFTGVLGAGFGLLAVWVHRKFRFLPDGIEVAYPFCRPKKIVWSDISEVAVCHIHRSKNRNGVIAIRIAVGDVFASSDDPYGLWQMCFEFSLKYQNNIIIFEYTKELEEEFRQICPIPIKKLVT
jgi:hypothetical protein